jgi:hypothetical protein
VSSLITHLIVGPDRHGVVRFGVELDAALNTADLVTRLCRVDRVADVSTTFAVERGVHLQFTDRLFGASAQQAAAAVLDLIARVHRSGSRVTATLHDLPQNSDGTNHVTRAHAYFAVAKELDAVVVSSVHERVLLSDIGIDGSTVIPLPITPPVPAPFEGHHPATVAVFGFVYPGKGHAEVLAAMTGLGPGIAMLAIGEPSAGHDELIDELDRDARAAGRRFTVTGHVPDQALTEILRGVTVPVVHHRHVSASGSLNAWLSAGRRPLAPATRYSREIADRNPGALSLYPDDDRGLAAAIRAALDEPSSTWLAPETVCSPTPDDAGRCYRHLLRRVHR